MSASEKLNESVLLAAGGVIQENGKPSDPILSYNYSTLYAKDVLLQAVKGVRAMNRTARMLANVDPKLSQMLTDMVEDDNLVLAATRSVDGKYIESMTTQKGRFVVKGDEQAKKGMLDGLKQMFSGGGDGGGGKPSAI